MSMRSWIGNLIARRVSRPIRKAPHRFRPAVEALEDRTVNGNKANGSVLGEGGGIYSSDSVLTLVDSFVKGNKASTAFDDLFDGP
jgi:hypothetical protein